MTFEKLPLAHPDGVFIESAKAKDLNTIYTTLCRTLEAQEFFKTINLATVALMEIYKQPRVVINRDAVNITDKAVVFYNQYRPEEYPFVPCSTFEEIQSRASPCSVERRAT
jgi:hypothetical protein